MHELSVTESLLEIALRHGKQASAHRITDIYLVIGRLSSIVDDSIQFYWDFTAKGTIAEGALLHFRRIPAEFLCLDCDQRFTPAGDDFACPQCSSSRVRTVAGEEFYLESLGIET
jgi:hydrogenase nickel incorporation protein HypA/HybF